MSTDANKALDALKIEAEAHRIAERAANHSAFVGIFSKAYDARTCDEHSLAISLFSELCPFFPPVPNHLQNARKLALEHSYPHFAYNLFNRGSTLCAAGAPCNHVIFLLKGSVKTEIVVGGSTPTNCIEYIHAPGSIFGEIEALKNDGRWASTAIGTENGEYLSINKSAFARLFELGTYASLSEAKMLMRIRGFHRLGPIETLMSLCTGIQRKMYSAGSIYLKEGDPLTCTVFVKDGSIRVCKKVPDDIQINAKSGDPFNFHEYRSQFFKPQTDKEHLVTLSMVGRDEILCYPFKQSSAIPTSEFTYIVHTGSVLLLLNLDQFKGKLNISTQGRHEIRKYMTKFDGQRKGRCDTLSKASEHVGSMMQDRSESNPWHESFYVREETLVVPQVILPELIGSPSKSKVGQSTALDSKIGREIFATLSTKLINIRKTAALSLDAAAVSDTYSYAAVSKAQSFLKNQYDKSFQERTKKFNQRKLSEADHSFSNLPENSGFSVLLRRSMELIGSFEENSLAHKALDSKSSPQLMQTKSVLPGMSNTTHLQSRPPILSPHRSCMFVEEKTGPSLEMQSSPMQIFDRRELGIIQHARSTLTIRHQPPIYMSRQTMELSPNTTSDRKSLSSQHQPSPRSPASKQTSSRAKSHIGFSVSDELNSWLPTHVAKDGIPRERHDITVRPCSHNTPRPTSSNSVFDRAKGL